MASTKEIKRRIKLVKTTSQITRAMELVSGTKMRKAEADARATREYAKRAEEILARLMEHSEGRSHPLLAKNISGKTLALIISPDRGLAGALTTNVLREAQRALSSIPKTNTDIMTIGKKGQDFFRKTGYELRATATRLDWKPHIFAIRPFAKLAIDGYLEKKYEKVILIFSNFISASSQKPTTRMLLPFVSDQPQPKADQPLAEGARYQYLIEPSPQVVLDSVIRNLIEMQIFQALLEGNASEHSARMVAMHSATENAKDLNADLTLSFNQIRQEGITREIAEISAGANA